MPRKEVSERAYIVMFQMILIVFSAISIALQGVKSHRFLRRKYVLYYYESKQHLITQVSTFKMTHIFSSLLKFAFYSILQMVSWELYKF